MTIILYKRHWKKEVQPETKSHRTTELHSLHQSVQTDEFVHISACVNLHFIYIRMACPPKSVSCPRDLIIMLRTVSSSKIDHRYPAARGKEMKKETANEMNKGLAVLSRVKLILKCTEQQEGVWFYGWHALLLSLHLSCWNIHSDWRKHPQQCLTGCFVLQAITTDLTTHLFAHLHFHTISHIHTAFFN